MDGFTGLLTRDFGFKPQGKSAPMTSSKKPDSSPVFDDPDHLFNDVFSRPSKPDSSPSAPSFDYDDMFKTKPAPVYDKPVFDDDVYDEAIPELIKVPSTWTSNSQSARFDNVFASMTSPSRHRKQNSSPLDDFMEDLGKVNKTESDKGSSVFDDLIPGFGRSSSPQTKRPNSEMNESQKASNQTAKISSNFVEDPFVVLEESASTTPRGFTDPLDEIGKFNTRKTDPQTTSPVYENAPHMYRENLSEHKSHNSDGSFESSDDVWLTVSEIPLFTQPTSAPPPNRPPPPRPTRPIKKKVNEPSVSSSTNHANVHNSAARASHLDELDEFSMGRNQAAANGYPEPPFGEDLDGFSAAAASAAIMKDAMDKAELKFRHAKEMREKENLKASRSKEGCHMDDYRERELREKQVRLDRERAEREEMERAQEREREEREREQKRNEKERERLLARQAVERATREARERAATEAHAKVQRAAVGKATDARERSERAAVQRAHAEARERAAAGAREKAEKAAAEAKERANAEAREKEARVRAERAAVERAAAEARGRAAAQAKAKQQENNNDLDSFFNSVSRPSSAPRQRTNPPDPFQDSWNKGGSFESSKPSSRVPSGPTENLRKTSSATNIVDDLSSIFGGGGPAAAQFGGFPDVEGETEERRRARLERHQRTQERAAKALAEKNERDLQVLRDQAERNRIGETLDVEIKRWGAGKEGNLRALLSTLQYVLWPECGWQPVSLTDLITGASVKKVYRKATLCIHPDKVQQKGANLQQKYIAEKVFDMLKEAWNKFNSEELF